MKTQFQIRMAQPDDVDAMLKILPRLGEFELAPGRKPEDLWRDDAKLLRQVFAGEAPQCFAQVAVSTNNGGTILGMTLVTMQPEFMNHEPSGHLEAISVAPDAEGMGVGRALLDAAEQEALDRGAGTMTLHVYATNHRARAIYERRGYQIEIHRCTKPLGATGSD